MGKNYVCKSVRKDILLVFNLAHQITNYTYKSPLHRPCLSLNSQSHVHVHPSNQNAKENIKIVFLFWRVCLMFVVISLIR